MSGAERHGPRYRFAGFELEPCERRLTAQGQPVTVTPKVFDTLVLLVQHAGHVVSKDELMAALWPRGFVSESNLTKQVWAIRKALSGGEGECDSRFVETVSKLGYRFVAPVERIDGDLASGSGPPSKPVPTSGIDGDGAAVELPVRGSDASRLERRTIGRRQSDREVSVGYGGAGASRRWGRGVVIVAIVAIVLLVIGGVGAGLLWQRTPPSRAQSPSGAAGNALAIIAFNNMSENSRDAWLGPALTEMLATEVTVDSRLHALPSELVRPAYFDLATPGAGGYAPASLAKLRQRLGAEYVLSGNYLVSGVGADAKVRLDLVLQDARTGADIANFSGEGPESDLPGLIDDTGSALRGKLGIKPIGASEVSQLANAQPPTTDVARRMGLALDALQDYDPARARDEALQAIAQVPGYAPAYILLARAWSELGFHDKALAAINQAAAHAAGLPEDQRLSIAAQQHVLAYRPAAAAAVYKQLIALHPDDPEPRRQLVDVLTGTDRQSDVKQALGGWRTLPGATTDPRWELAASKVAQKYGDFLASIEHARRALALAEAHDIAGIVANAELQYGIVLGQDNQRFWEQSISLLRAAVRDCRAIGNLHCEAHGDEMLGVYIHDQPRHARESLQRAMSVYQQIGDLDGQARVYSQQSRILWQQGDADGAAAALKEAVKIYHVVGDFSNEVWSTAGLARMEADSSASDGVVVLYRKLLTMESRLGDVRISAYTRANFGDLLRERGQLVDAREACTQAEKQVNIKGYQDYLNTVKLVCVGVVRDSGDIAAASALLAQVVHAAGGESRLPLTALASVIPLAAIDIERRQWTDARDLLKPWVAPAAAQQQESGRTTIGAQANALIALCYQALGDTAARDRAALHARNLRQRVTENRTLFVVDVALARLQGEMGDRAAAVAKLRELAIDADKRHWMASSLEARLAAHELLQQERGPGAAALHNEIEAIAKAQGFNWVLARLYLPSNAVTSAVRN